MFVLTSACRQGRSRRSCAGPLTVPADKQRLVCEQGVQPLSPICATCKVMFSGQASCIRPMGPLWAATAELVQG
ncbi:hypothetical protein ABBQ32_003659 [Trebouxia sp. C0010 RCD-2024]